MPNPTNPYAPRSTEYLTQLLREMEGKGVEVTDDMLQEAGGNPEVMRDLVEQRRAADVAFQNASGRNYTSQAGRVVVANPLQAIADMFVRGRAKRERGAASKSIAEREAAQAGAQARLRATEARRAAYDRTRAELADVERGNQQLAIAEAAEATRQRERGEDRADKTLRQQIDDAYRREELGLSRERLAAERAPKPMTVSDQLKLAEYQQSQSDRETKVLDNATSGLALIQKLKSHPGLTESVGFRLGVRSHIPGTDASNFIALNEQLQGKAFLEAFQALRGAGAITEKEGAAATAAMAQLDRNQSEEQYLESLNVLEGVYSRALARIGGHAPAGNSGGATGSWSVSERK